MSDTATETETNPSDTPNPSVAGGMLAAVEEAVEQIRPLIQMDGGDISLHSVDEETGKVIVELSGACVGCAASSMTLKAGVERILTDRVPGVTEVTALGLDDDHQDDAC